MTEQRTMCRHCGVNFTKDEPIERDGWWVDPLMGAVAFNGQREYFTFSEVQYLHGIMKAGRGGIRKEALFNRVCDDEDTDIQIVDVLVCKLRKKMSIIDPNHVYIKTMWGVGYAWFKEACIRHPAFQAEAPVVPEIETVVVRTKKKLRDPRWERRMKSRKLKRSRS